MKIMVADDSGTDRKLLMSLLSPLGHELVEARDGEEAEKIFFEHKPDLVFLDVIMPKKDGFQVCREIKTHSEFGKTPVVLVSGKTQESDRFWGMKQGADKYLGKPLNREMVLKAIREIEC